MIGKGQAEPAPRGSRAPAGQPEEQPPAGQAARLAAALSLLRRHWLAAALLAAGLVLRVLAQFAYRPALFYIDTTRYVSNNPPGMDPLGYGGVLRAISPAGGLAAVAAVQHLLGLAMAVVIYVLLLRRGVARWLAALAIAPVLLDAYQLQIEQTIMPDTRVRGHDRGRPGDRGVAPGDLLAAGRGRRAGAGRLGHRRPGGRGAAGTRGDLRAGGGRRLAAGDRPVGGPGRGVRRADPGLLGGLGPDHRVLLPVAHRRHVLLRADRGGRRLRHHPAAGGRAGDVPDQGAAGAGPDWLEYNQGSPIRPYYTPAASRAQTDSEISDFNHAVLAQQPGRLLAAYGRDAAKLFALTRTGSRGDTPISRWQFQRAFPYYPPWSSRQVVSSRDQPARRRRRPPSGGRSPRSCAPTSSAAATPLARCSRSRRWPGWLARLAARRTAERGIRQAALGCLLFFASGVFILGVSDLFEFSWRYQLPALVTLVPAGALGISVIIGSIRARHRSS